MKIKIGDKYYKDEERPPLMLIFDNKHEKKLFCSMVQELSEDERLTKVIFRKVPVTKEEAQEWGDLTPGQGKHVTIDLDSGKTIKEEKG